MPFLSISIFRRFLFIGRVVVGVKVAFRRNWIKLNGTNLEKVFFSFSINLPDIQRAFRTITSDLLSQVLETSQRCLCSSSVYVPWFAMILFDSDKQNVFLLFVS